MAGINKNLHLTIFCLKLSCGFYTHFEMWDVILKRRDYLEDIAISGRIEMHLERRFLGHVKCIYLALSRDQRWDVVITQFKPINMGNFLPDGSFIAESRGTMQFNLEFLIMLAECEENLSYLST